METPSRAHSSGGSGGLEPVGRGVRSAADGPDHWTTRRLLGWMNEAFGKAGISEPRRCADMLMSHVIGCDRLKLYTDADRPATPLERQSLRDLVSRALKHEPVQYLVGEAWFYGLQFAVDARVLIPRPSTETIVDTVLSHARAAPGLGGPEGDHALIGDCCTGSGCIAISLLKHMKRARAIASDVSREALESARVNALRHGVADRLDLVEGDLLAPILNHPGGRGLSYLTANPPYIPDDEWEAVEPNVKDHEPTLALRGGPDGMNQVRPIIEEAHHLLLKDGLLLVEIACSRAALAMEIAASNAHLTDARIERDMDGLERVLVARRV